MSGMSRTKVVIDYDACESNAVCMGIAPEVFDLDEDDNLVLLQEYPPQALLERVRPAVDSCPKRALALETVDDE